MFNVLFELHPVFHYDIGLINSLIGYGVGVFPFGYSQERIIRESNGISCFKRANTYQSKNYSFRKRLGEVFSSSPLSDCVYSTAQYLNLRSAIDRSNIAHINRSTLYPMGKLIQVISRKPTVYTIHNLPHPEQEVSITSKIHEERLKIWLYFIARNNVQTVTVSQYMQNELRRYGVSSKVIHHGVDLKMFNTSVSNIGIKKILGVMKKEKVILWVGYFDPLKDPQTFLESIPLIAKNVDGPLTFIFVISKKGQIHDKTMERISCIRRTGIKVTVLEALPYSIMPYVYSACDVFVSTSIIESFGLAPLEAMACGKPSIIAQAKRPVLEIVGDSCLVFRQKNALELSDKVTLFLENDSLRYRVGGFLNRRVSEEFTWQIAASKYMSIYKELLGR